MRSTDWIWIISYLAIVLALGLWGGRGRQEKNTDDYFVGGRRMPWLAILGSLIATEISAATFLSVPGVGFSENMTYLQFGVGSIVARIFVATYFLKFFFDNNCLSIYQFFEKRFGNKSQITASLYFIITRLLASGVRLMIAVTGISVILDLPFLWCLIAFAMLTFIYTSLGGIKAVIWTDCFQAVVFLSAGLVTFVFIGYSVGWGNLINNALEADRLEVFRVTPDMSSGLSGILNDPQWFFTAVIFGFLSTLGAMGTDQDMVQRLLCSENVTKARRSLVLSGFIAIPVASLFLLIGIGLFSYFASTPLDLLPVIEGSQPIEVDSNKIFPHFIASDIPFLLRGLLIMGLFAAAMSSLDSAMAALSSSAVTDLLEPAFKETVDERMLLVFSRWTTLLFAVLLVLIAVALQDGGTFLWLAFKVTSLTYSGLLGLFFLGMFTSRGSDQGNVIAMLSGTVAACLYLWGTESGVIPLAWTWVIVIGAAMAFTVGFSFNPKHRN